MPARAFIAVQCAASIPCSMDTVLAEAHRVQGHAVAHRHMPREMQHRIGDVEGLHGAVGSAIVALPLGGGERCPSASRRASIESFMLGILP